MSEAERSDAGRRRGLSGISRKTWRLLISLNKNVRREVGKYSILLHMHKSLVVGLLSGVGLAFLLLYAKRRRANLLDDRKAEGSRKMTTNEKLVASAREAIAAKPEASTPGHEFLRDWAYGNAGLEDERITLEQVESVMREKSA